MNFFNNYGNFILFILGLVICGGIAACLIAIRRMRLSLGAQKFQLKCIRCSEAKTEYFAFYITNASLNDRILSNFGIEVSGHHIDIGRLSAANADGQGQRLIKQRNSLVYNIDVIAVENEVFAVADRYGISNVKLYSVDGMGILSVERVSDLEKMLKKDLKADRKNHRGFSGRFNMPKTGEESVNCNTQSSAAASSAEALPPAVREEPLPPTVSFADRIKGIFKKKK